MPTETSDACPFCSPPADRVFLELPLVYALWDGFPVNPGHALLIPRRHVSIWFDATEAEQEALIAALPCVKAVIDRGHHPDGYNVGVNIGTAAGQTIPHLHLHLIPRYAGDVPEPRGGVRHVIPSRGNYPVR